MAPFLTASHFAGWTPASRASTLSTSGPGQVLHGLRYLGRCGEHRGQFINADGTLSGGRITSCRRRQFSGADRPSPGIRLARVPRHWGYGNSFDLYSRRLSETGAGSASRSSQRRVMGTIGNYVPLVQCNTTDSEYLFSGTAATTTSTRAATRPTRFRRRHHRARTVTDFTATPVRACSP